MPGLELFLLFTRPLNLLGIQYIIGGSVAAIFYGEPRLTNDVDFVFFLDNRDAQRLADAFPTPEFYFPPVETVLAENHRLKNGHFNIIHNPTSFKADVYLSSRDELSTWGLQHRRQIIYEGENVVLAPPEYVIARKLEYYREGGSEKHLRDIRSILKISESRIDLPVLVDWIQRLGLETEWRVVNSV